MSSWDALKEKGNQYFKDNNFEKAIEFYNKAIELNGEQEVLYSNKGTCEKCLGEYKLAVKDYKKSLEINPKNAKNLNRLASVYLILGNFGEASVVQEKAVNLEPGNATFKSQLNSIKMQIEKWEKIQEKKKDQKYEDVEELCKKMLEVSPEFPELKLEYIRTLVELVKLTEALSFINSKVTKADKDFSDDFDYLIALVLYYDGNYDKANKKLLLIKQKGINNDKINDLSKKLKEIEKIKNEANEIFKQGKYDEAIESYTKILDFDPSNKKFNSLIYANRALCYQKKKMNTEALKDSNMSVKLNPYYARGYLKRGNVYMNLEMYDDAKADFQKAKELDPNLKDVQGFLNDANKASSKAKNRDYYAILGVDRNADEKEIKRAYKKAALKYHPDRNGESEETKKMAEKKFIDVNDAYSVLSDPNKKRMYDQGMDPLNPETGGGAGGMHFSGGDMSDILNVFFGGGSPFGDFDMGGGNSGTKFTFSFGGPGSSRGRSGRGGGGSPFSMFFH